MAIYHYHRNIGKRAEGKNAVFAAAYIRGEKRTCEKIEKTKDFSFKENVVYKNTFLPHDAPDWAKQLRYPNVKDSHGHAQQDNTGEQFSTYAWNQIEFIENRCDSQLYYHDDIALPNNLMLNDAISLTEDFVQNVLCQHGLFCDVAIHWEEGNHHIHVMLPTRSLSEAGFDKKRRITRQQLSQEVTKIREAWADYANRKMQTCGFQERIDHRSYQDRGLDLTPTVKVGKFNYAAQEVISQRKAHENRCIALDNAHKVFEKPAILSKKLAQENLVFSEDIVRDASHQMMSILQDFYAPQPNETDIVQAMADNVLAILKDDFHIINEKHIKSMILESSNGTALFEDLYHRVITHDDIMHLGLGDDGRHHFVSRTAFEMENRLIANAASLLETSVLSCKPEEALSVAMAFGLNASQQKALLHLTSTQDIALVCGYAGTGKTYLLNAAKTLWDDQGFKVIGLSTSGKATSGLEDETGMTSYTIAGFLKGIKAGTVLIDSKTVLVMDEMGMTSMDDMDAILTLAREWGAKFTGVGDIEQTQPVGRGASFKAMVEAVGAVYLDNIVRQKVDWQREATYYFETHQTEKGLALYEEHGRLHFAIKEADAQDALLADWIAKVDSQGENALDGLVIAAFTNQAVDALNDKARSILVARGFLEQGKIISGRSIAVGERLLFTKNDYKSGYRNGHFATVNALQENAIVVTLDNGKQLSLPLKALENCRYGYAATIHKLQGYTGNETFLMVDGRNWDRQKLLVGGSRHRYDLNIYASKENFAHVQELKEVLSRHGLNDALYDYPVSYATRRGYNTENVAKVAVGRFSKLKRNVYDGLSYLFNLQQAVDDLASQKEESPRIMLEQRRRDATIVATFADNRAEIAALLAVDASENQARIYRLRQENGRLAANILKDPAHFKRACERNRITTERLTQAYDFSAKADRVNRLSSQYRNSESLHAEDAYLLSERLKDFYPHITMVFVDRYERQAFLNHVLHESHALRREKALEHFGMDRRADINQVMRYLQINDHISRSFEQNKPLLEREKEAFFSLLNDREKQAHDLLNSVHKEELLTFFHLDKSRLKTQASSYEDKLQVMAFDRLEKTPINQRGLLQKQHLAYRFRKDSKRFSKHILAVCKEGFKTVNLENWQYEKRLKEAKMSPEMKASFNRVKDYKAVASLAYTAWKKAFACQQKYSDAHKKSILRAQGFTYQRMRFAHAIVADLSSHLAALSTHRVDTKRLVQEARVVTYLQRYQAEVKAPLKLHMAHYISMNLKEYRAGLTYLGLEQEVYEKASHYQYLKTLKKAPSVEHKQLIRLTYQYQKRAYEAALLYKSTMTYPKKQTQSVLEQRMVRQAFEKRNQIAASIDAVIKQHPHLQSEGTLERFNVKKIHQQAAAFHTTKNKKPSRALPHSKLTTHSPIHRNAIEREVGKALDYTAAEKQIKEDYGLAAVGLQDLRFDEKSNLLWVPFTHDFNKASTYTDIPLEKLTDPWLMSPNGFYVAQKPDITHRLYIVNNLLDAKALSVVAERDAMVVMASEDRFSLLSEQLEKASIHPLTVMIVTDSHSEQSKRDNALKAKIFSDKGATLYLAKGRVQENVSNVWVHEAFSRSEKIRGIDSILHTLKLDPMKAKKATLTSRFKKRLRQKHFEEKARIAMTRPSSLNHAPYYMTLSKPEKEGLLQYLKAHQHLKTHNHLKAAKERMHQSRAVMTILRDKIKILSRHPQYEHLKSERTSKEIHTLLNQHEKLSLTDFKAVLTHLNQVLMDKETEKSINNYVQGLKEKKPLGELKAFFNQEQLQFIQEVVRFNPVSDQSLENFSGSTLPVLHLMRMVERRLSSRAKGETLDSEQERSLT